MRLRAPAGQGVGRSVLPPSGGRDTAVILLLPGAASRDIGPACPPLHRLEDPTMLQKVKPAVTLKDMSLFRQQCYIDGAWVDADSKATLAVYNPADGVQIGTVPDM